MSSDYAHLDVGDDAEFRALLRTFLTEHGPGKRPKDPAGRLDWQRRWQAVLFDGRWAGPSWPRDCGGMDLPFTRQVIYSEELARARVPNPPGTGVGIAGPTIIKYGTDEQRARWLPALLRADQVWAQGYSEPEAGSDLPSLRTTARRDGDDYVVTGQKVWSTQAQIADVLFALVRTGTQESRQNGITYLVLDLHAPGVTVRPLRDLTGGAAFGEVFLDEVRVPVTNRIGAENEGWRLARTSLGHERAAGAMIQASFYQRVFGELVALARERGTAADPVWSRRLADLGIRVKIMALNAASTIAAIEATGEPGPASSVSRLYNSTLEQELHEIAVDMLGPYGLLDGGPDAVQRGRWVGGFLRTRASTIGAGTAEIQRNTIAEQVLGLPRDPAMPPR
ncbi:MAG TPA: acyl-CoA dehydrogenase family protein [Mycobacteriales bacterium]|nr:acyl-CoA dehydrogenase family protein [Mycobacteriales bacterium]